MQDIRLSRRDKISITTGETGGYNEKNNATLKGLNIFIRNLLQLKTPENVHILYLVA